MMRNMRKMWRMMLMPTLLAGGGSYSSLFAQVPIVDRAQSKGWISYPGADVERPVVLHFRRALTVTARPKAFPVRISADNGFILYINGQRVVSGPSTSDAAHWRCTSVDLAPFLRLGRNEIVATVWNYVKLPVVEANQAKAYAAEMFSQTGRFPQQTIGTGLWLDGAGIGTLSPGWEVMQDLGRTPVSGARQVGLARYYVAGAPERIDARAAFAPWQPADTRAGTWVAAVRSETAGRTLSADPLPHQRYVAVPSGVVVRTSLDAARVFPAKAVTIPANSQATLLIRRDAMVSAYPELRLSGGRDAKIRMTYAEALYDDAGRKGDRNALDGRHIDGIHDDIIASGFPVSIMPLWWRTWRYLEISVETAGTPLTLEGLKTWETGYPFETRGYFRSSDPELDRIWQVGWRTALVDAHDTYMDSSYWEQLQYVGDTRLQMLISYAVSGDPRLAVQAIDAFAGSDVDGGLVEGAWPSRGTNAIAPFSLLWVGMLHDWMAEQPDKAVIIRNLPRMRKILRWFEAWQSPTGLLRKNPQWNFIDWVGQGAGDRTRFPSYGKAGESCLTSILYLGALQQAGDLETAYGSARVGQADRLRAATVRRALRRQCYVPDKGLFADNPDQTAFSQQMNALAVLYDVATPDEAPALLDRIVAPGKGIDAPNGIVSSSYYFAWYLVQAFTHAGLADRYPQLLRTWRDLLTLNYTTWPEERGDTRSDTHAWSAHPTADLLRLVAGIGPGAPGYAKLRVAPALGDLNKLEAAAMTPSGLVSVRYRVDRATLFAEVDRPAALPGWFEWQGVRHPLKGTRTILTLPIRAKAH